VQRVSKLNVPPLITLGEFALAAASNSGRLIRDAELLASRGSYPTASSLAILAFEEAGKAWLCVQTMMVPSAYRSEYPLGELMARHTDKLMAAHAQAAFFRLHSGEIGAWGYLAGVFSDIERLACEHDKLKQQGFYADLGPDGAVRTPVQQVSREAARKLVATVAALIIHASLMADPGFVTWLAEEEPSAVQAKDFMWRVFVAGLQEGTPEGMLSKFQEALGEIGATEDELREAFAGHVLEIEAARPAPRKQPRRPPPRSARRSRTGQVGVR
jgi:AbiV family abortive infection protein